MRGGLLAGLVFALAGAPARAQVSVGPPLFDLQVGPGATVRARFIVNNSGAAPAQVRVSVRDWWRDKSGPKSGPIGTAKGRSAARWITLASPSTTVPARGRAELEFAVTAAADAAGGYYAALAVEPVRAKAGPSQNTLGMQLGYEYVLPVLVRVGGAQPALSIQQVRAQPGPQAGLLLEVLVQNRGDVHAALEGNVVLIDGAGAVHANAAINRRVCLPGEERALSAPWTAPVAAGRYRAVATLIPDGLAPITAETVVQIGAAAAGAAP